MDYDRDLETKEQEDQEENGEELEWDGSEAELVADDDAAVYEDPQTGIRLNYVLKQEEIYQCLKNTGFIKTTGSRAIAETVILAAAMVVFLISWFTGHDTNSLIFAVVSLVLIGIVWVVPELGLRRHSRRMARGDEMAMEIYPDAIVLVHGEKELEIPLDGTAQSAQYGNIMVLFHQGKMAILPLRCVEPSVLPEVQAMIISGTTPRE